MTPAFPPPGGGGRSFSLSVLPLGMHLLEELPVIGHRPFSDYDAFRNAGVPFVFLSAGRTPRYHQPTDLPDTLHYERMASTVTWLEQFVRLIDQDQEPYEVEPGRIELADEVETLRALVEQASQWKTRIPGTSPLSLFRLKLDARWLRTIRSSDRDNGRREGRKPPEAGTDLDSNAVPAGQFLRLRTLLISR